MNQSTSYDLRYILSICVFLFIPFAWANTNNISPKTEIEISKLISTNNELSKSDKELNQSYNILMKYLTPNEIKALKEEQRTWLKERTSIFNESKDLTTIQTFYKTRNQELEKKLNALSEELSKNKAKMDLALIDFNQTFKFLGENISPKVISEFEIWISDGGTHPAQISTDIAAISYNSNRYYGDFKVVKYENDSDKDWVLMEKESGFVEYKWYGRLKNGLHIVQMRNNDGGSLTTLTLYAFRSTVSQGLYETPHKQIKPYYRLLLEQVLQVNVPLYGNLVLKDNTVESIRDNKILWKITFPE